MCARLVALKPLARMRSWLWGSFFVACALPAGAADLAKGIEALQSGKTEQAEREFTAITREDAADPARRKSKE